MKKLFLFLLPLFFTPVMLSAYNIGITGHVGSPGGPSVPFSAVYMSIDSVSGYSYYGTVYTNQYGYYNNIISNVPLSSGILHIFVYDCNNQIHQVDKPFSSSNNNIYQDFFGICFNPTCNAAYTYANGVPLTVVFSDLSTGAIVSRYWDFGDGQTSTLQNPVHTYPAPGYYTVWEYVYGNSSSGCYDSISQTVHALNTNPPCNAAFYDSVYNGNPLMVYFIDQSTGNINSWNWNFGDGQTSTLQNPVHQYNAAGAYIVTLQVTGTDTTCNSLITQTVTVSSGPPCIANFTYAINPVQPMQVTFNDLSMGNIISWYWEFGDGQTSTLQNPVHVYTQSGVYNVNLQVHGIDSLCYSQDTKVVTILPQSGCQANFQISTDSLNTNLVHFTDLSMGSVISWNWNFGDGNYSTVQNPTHMYPAGGIYYVCLTIFTQDSCTSNYCDTLFLNTQGNCNAAFTSYPDSSGMGRYFFDGSLGVITYWDWNFGDPASGINNVSSIQNPYHIFSHPGVYYVCLTISGPSCQDTQCDTVYVLDTLDCHNYFSYQAVNLTVDFMGYITGNSNGSFNWNFGDGSTGTGQNPQHIYAQPGTYYVALTTVRNDSCMFTSYQYITVGDPGSYSQIWGQVYEGSFPLAQGIAFLFSVDSTGNYFPFVDASVIDSLGIYYFAYVPQGSYYIWAVPYDTSYLSTFYGDVVYWQTATVVNVGVPANPYNIHLVQSSGIAFGNGIINGNITGGRSPQSMVDKISVMIRNSSGDILGFRKVAEDGTFDFTHIAYGTYYLVPVLPGCPSDVIEVTLDADHSTVTVNMSYDNGKINGITDKADMVSSFMTYPNPAGEVLNVVLDLKKAENAEITLYDLSGRMIINEKKSFSAGDNKFSLQLSGIRSGSYILRISSADGLNIRENIIRKP